MSLGGPEDSVSLNSVPKLLHTMWIAFAASITLYPPTSCCTYDGCDRTRVLKKSQARNVVVYTLDGAFPAISIHLTCDSEFLCWLDGRIHADVMASNLP